MSVLDVVAQIGYLKISSKAGGNFCINGDKPDHKGLSVGIGKIIGHIDLSIDAGHSRFGEFNDNTHGGGDFIFLFAFGPGFGIISLDPVITHLP